MGVSLELLVLVEVYLCVSCMPVIRFSGWYCANPLAGRVIVTLDPIDEER